MLKKFKAFIAKGNVMDMAIGVVMGTAFTAIVKSMVNDIIMPIVAFFIGSTDFTAIVWRFGGTKIMIGNFIQTIVQFLIIAVVLFLVMQAVAILKDTFEHGEKEEADQKMTKEEVLLTEIRDLLKQKS